MRLLVLALLAACGDPTSSALVVDLAVPSYAPLVGGSRVALLGAGFTTLHAPRVLVDGRESPLVAIANDSELDLVVPPGEQPGDVELVVFDGAGSRSLRGLFHYSAPPELAGAAPHDVLYTDSSAVITLTGRGFRDEAPGDLGILIDGQPPIGISIVSDTELRVVVPGGAPLSEPTIELADARGLATLPRAFRYVPSLTPGLLLFPTFSFGGTFAVFLDPITLATVAIPWRTGATTRFTSVVRAADGDYWAMDRGRRFGRLDLHAQRIVENIPTSGLYPAMTAIGNDTFAIERDTATFGRLELATGTFTQIGKSVPCCGSYGMAFDGTTLFLVARDGVPGIRTLDRTTGALGTAMPLAGEPGLHVEELRYAGGKLYATTRTGSVVTIDPTTGVATTLLQLGRFGAMEVFE